MTSPAFGDYQLEIYGAGLRGVVPTFPMALAELEARAAPPASSSSTRLPTGTWPRA